MFQSRLHYFPLQPLIIGVIGLGLALLLTPSSWSVSSPASSMLLSEPFLLHPTADSVQVVWFTEFPGTQHILQYGLNLENSAIATTTKLSKLREDAKSKIPNPPATITTRDVWRHVAIAKQLPDGQSVSYRVSSLQEHQQAPFQSQIYQLQAAPKPGQPLKILLTSDHQLKPMVAANLEKAAAAIGRFDSVFFAGDLANVPDRASEWFDDERGGAFFPCLQGRAHYQLHGETYRGAAILQATPIFPALGNHEVMGRLNSKKDLNGQFADAYPRWAAQKYLNLDPKTPENLKNNSFNADSYREIFDAPDYYAVTFGDIRLVVLYVTQIWRSPTLEPNQKGRYKENDTQLDDPTKWGFGQHIFESLEAGSPQYRWLSNELVSSEFQQAKYKIVMLHHPPHTLGGNGVPPYTHPQQQVETEQDKTTRISYFYPPEQDLIIRDLIPLLENAGVQFVFYGHSHLWNRFQSESGMHFLETSNVGNSYGAHWEDLKPRAIPPNTPYAATGDPNGLSPIVPTLNPLSDQTGRFLPFVASNQITVFSVFDSTDGSVTSYRFDTRDHNNPVIPFDRFYLKNSGS
ncbi:MAG: metallophosphoesterase [Cyanobacteria bacterium P01_H01_bin.15]